MKTLGRRAHGRRVGICIAILTLCIAMAGCNRGSGEALQKVSEGKLAPPGAELLSESTHDGDPGEAIALRLYAAHELPMEEVAAFYEGELLAAGWQRKEPTARKDHLTWSDGRHVIILNLMTTQFRITVQEVCCERYAE